MSFMRGIRISEFGDPSVLKYVTDLPIPAKPTGRQVLVRVKSIGVNPVDTYIRTGIHVIKPELPYTPGIDGAGVVEDVGESVTKLKIGLASCQIARSLGAFIVGTAGTEQGTKLILSNGAHLAFNHREEGYVDKIKAAVKGFDVIIEMLANVNLEKDLELIGVGGRLTIVGSRGKTEVTPRAVMTNEVNVMGAGLYRATEAEYAEMGAYFFAGQEQGWLRPVVDQEYTLEQAEQSHVEVIEHKNGSHGKIVINV